MHQSQNSVPGDCIELIRTRRTINFFKPETVPDALILNAIEVARWAPNHKKTEPWHFYMLGPDTRSRVKALITELKTQGQDPSVRDSVAARLEGIPGWLVLACDVSRDELTTQEDYAACACAAQNLMLALWHSGIGTKWTTGKVIRDPRFLQMLGLTADTHRIVGLFWYGYPEHIPDQTRKPLPEITSKLD